MSIGQKNVGRLDVSVQHLLLRQVLQYFEELLRDALDLPRVELVLGVQKPAQVVLHKFEHQVQVAAQVQNVVLVLAVRGGLHLGVGAVRAGLDHLLGLLAAPGGDDVLELHDVLVLQTL